jgi:ankyrin repeat protein
LHQAAESGDITTLEDLLTKSPRPDLESRHGPWKQTPLHAASETGHSTIVRCLLDNGSKADSGNWKEDTPLHLAAAKGHGDVVDILVQTFDNPQSRIHYINKTNKYEQTALHEATLGDASGLHGLSIVEFLIGSGADLGPGIMKAVLRCMELAFYHDWM